MSGPAGLLRRAAAWSVDAVVIAVPAMLLSFAYWHPAWLRLDGDIRALATALATMMYDALQLATPPAQLAAQWLQDATLHAAILSLASTITRLLLPTMATFAVLAFVYHAGFEASRWQASPGKRLLQLQVTDLEGKPPGLARAMVRQAAGLLSWISLNLGHATALVAPQHRALHDRIAGARVIQQVPASTPLPAWAGAWLTWQTLAFFGAVAWLTLRLQAYLDLAFARLL